jgi:hypothetical protein
VILVVFAVVLAIPVGLVRGGSLRRLGSIHFRWIPLLAAALLIDLVIEAVVSDPSGLVKTLVTIGTFLLALVFVLANLHLGGMRVVALGLLSNLAAIVPNGAMPVSTSAARRASAPISGLNDGLKHEVLTHNTLLPWLADLFSFPNVQLVFSVGDVIIALGIGMLVVTQMTAPVRASGTVRGSVSG